MSCNALSLADGTPIIALYSTINAREKGTKISDT